MKAIRSHPIFLVTLFSAIVSLQAEAASDADYKEKILGQWKQELVQGPASMKGLETYNRDGTLIGDYMLSLQGQKIPIKLSGVWEIKNGTLIATVKKSNVPQMFPVGTVSKDKIVEINQTVYRYKTEDGELEQKTRVPNSGFVTAETSKSTDHAMRLWTDSTGKFKIEATLKELKKGPPLQPDQAVLQKSDGSLVQVPLNRLSAADQSYLRRSSSTNKITPKESPKPGARKPFPEHWGDPPQRQNRDLRPLPGGYGMGSGTLARWIQENLDRDMKPIAPATPAAPEIIKAPSNPDGGLGELDGSTGTIAVSPGDLIKLKDKISLDGKYKSRGYSKLRSGKETVKLSIGRNAVQFETGETPEKANVRIKGSKKFVDGVISEVKDILGVKVELSRIKLIAETITYAGFLQSQLAVLDQELAKTMTLQDKTTSGNQLIEAAFEKGLNGVRLNYSEDKVSLTVTIEGNREFVQEIKSLLNKIKKTAPTKD